MKTLYGLTKNDCTNKLALILWDRGKANSLDSAIKRTLKIKKFASC